MTRYLPPALLGFVLAVSLSAARAEERAPVASDDALAYLTIDIENSPGWMATVKGGYAWNFFRDVGVGVSGGPRHSRNYTKDGGAASIGFGYNFGPRLPLTLGLQFGVGPSGWMRQTTADANRVLRTRQKVGLYNIDFHLDYDFKNCSRWTPFVGLTAGAVLTSHKADAHYNDGANDYYGKLSKKTRVNFMAGARTGVKYAVNDRLTLSLYGAYNYLGTVKSRSFALNQVGGGGSVDARTQKIKAHSLEVKAGLRWNF